MFEVTETSASVLKDYFTQNKIEPVSPVRVTVMSGGCSGAALGLTLDQPGELDQVFEEGDLKFVIAQDLLEEVGAIKVDFVDAGYRSGFAITSEKPVPGAGGGCSSCGGSCGM